MKEKTTGIVIGIGNQKGGVGKTTNTVHLAAAFGERGYKVLVIDADPAAGATKHLGISQKSQSGTFELVTRRDSNPLSLAVKEGMPKNVSVIPSRTELAEVESYVSKYIDRTDFFREPLRKARLIYDLILIDTGPSARFLTTVSTYVAADWFLLSALPHALSVFGLNEALADIADVRANRNPNLEILGVVITGVDGRTKSWREVDALIKEHFPTRAFNTLISRAEAFVKASNKGKTLFQMRPMKADKVIEQYRELTTEIEWRIQNREQFLAQERGEYVPPAVNE
jgi:chromosome partitioning protein